MNSSGLHRDVSDYAAIVWRGRTFILLTTLAAVVLMIAMTAALPRLYILRSEVSMGAVVSVEPVETNLFVEAVDRSEFVPEGAEFGESLTDRLTASFRAPYTLVMEARVTDPVDGLRRLDVMTLAVLAELNARFDAAVADRERVLGLAATAQAAAHDRARQLTRVFDERQASAFATIAAAEQAASAAAGRRAELQREAQGRLTRPMLLLRQRLLREVTPPPVTAAIAEALERLAPEDNPRMPASVVEAVDRAAARQRLLSTLVSVNDPVLADLPLVFWQIAEYDLEIARAMESRGTAEYLLQREARAREVLAGASAADPDGAEAFERSLERLETFYTETNDPATARALREAASVMRVTANALHRAKAELDAPLLKRRPEIAVPPAAPAGPAWPRPMVNVVIAVIFGLVASIIIVVFRASRPERNPLS